MICMISIPRPEDGCSILRSWRRVNGNWKVMKCRAPRGIHKGREEWIGNVRGVVRRISGQAPEDV
jgi:hypothetical protein